MFNLFVDRCSTTR